MKAYLRLKWSVCLIYVLLMCTGITHTYASNIAGTYTSSTSLTPFNPRIQVTAFGLSGSVTLNSDSSMVRVLLEATDGTQYLVYEATPMLLNGMSGSFTNANEETFALNAIRLSSIKLIIHDASLYISETSLAVYNASSFNMPPSNVLDSLRRFRVQEKVNQINAYNQSHGILWRAAVTDISLLPHREKCRLIGIDNTDNSGGIEYYSSGIFEIGSRQDTALEFPDDSLYVDNFDWRYRHGKNFWVTPVRSQLTTNTCTIFATCSAIEAMANLHYNKKIMTGDYTYLSVPELGRYAYGSNYNYKKFTAYRPLLDYVKTKGVTYDCYIRFTGKDSDILSLPDERPTNPHVKISDYGSFNPMLGIKHYLINYGPVCFALNYQNDGIKKHALLLVGYKKINSGDIISIYDYNQNTEIYHTIEPGDFYEGKTCWILKDSSGNYLNGGYVYAIINSDICLPSECFYIIPPVNGGGLRNPLVEDADGDGYYTWGLGQPKPDSLPSWVPDVQDGDDSDSSKGPMNEYGHLLDLSYQPSDTIYINTDTEISGFQYLTTPIVVRNGATLTISGTLKCNSNGSIYVRNNSHLIVSESMLYSINLIGENGSDIRIDADSSVNISQDSGNYITLHR